MSGKMSVEKGKAGEREVAALLRAHGFQARRGQQFAGGNDSPDVIHSIPSVHLEVKRVEQFNLYAALDQAIADKPADHVPVVIHRKNKKPWVVVLIADDFLRLVGR